MPGDPGTGGEGGARRASGPCAVAYTSGIVESGYMASERQIHVGSVPVGGGAPVAVQTMTKTETANLSATMDQIRTVAEAGADIVRVAVPREQDAEALKSIVADSPIPIIADIHFNHTLALKAIEAGAHCVRLNPGNIGGPDKVAEVIALAKGTGTPLRVGVNSGSLPKHLRQLEYDDPVEALVTAAIETVQLMESLRLRELQGLDEVDLRAEHDRLQPHAVRADPLPPPPRRHRGGHEVVGLAEVSGRPGHAAGGRDRRHDQHLALDVPRRGGGEGRLGSSGR